MNGITLNAARPAPTAAQSVPELRKHAAEFEGILLSEILQKLKDSCRIPDGEDSDATSESFESFATSALGRGLASRGGLGLSELLVQSLTAGNTDTLKQPARSADKDTQGR